MKGNRIKFYPQNGLDSETIEALTDVPGVWMRPVLSAPYNAGWVIEDILQKKRIPYKVQFTPRGRPGSPWHRIRTSELHEWMVTDFLLNFQMRTIERACSMASAHIWAPPGSGKTPMALAYALAEPGDVLIITSSPLTVLEQWRREVERFTTGLKPFVYRAPSKRRKGDVDDLQAYKRRCVEEGIRPFVIAGWSMLREHWAELAQGVATVVFDESHNAKQAKRDKWLPQEDGSIVAERVENTSRAAFEIAKSARRRLCTTATPIPNQIWTDLWGQLTLVEPWGWGRTSRRFEKRHCNGHTGDYGWVCDAVTRVDELKKRLSFSSIRVPYETSHAELPAKRRQIIYVAPEDQVKAAASAKGGENLKRELKKAKKTRDQDRLLELRLMEAAGVKRNAIRDMVKDRIGDKAKVIVFTGRREDCAALGKAIQTSLKKKLTIDENLWVASGDRTQKERLTIMDAYMAHEGPCVLVGTYQAWGTSLNLQDTDHLIFGMLPYTPGMLEQAEGRVHRLGMDRPVQITYLIAEETVDETIADLVLGKLASIEKVVDAGGLDGLSGALEGLEDKETMLDDMMSRLDLGEDDE